MGYLCILWLPPSLPRYVSFSTGKINCFHPLKLFVYSLMLTFEREKRACFYPPHPQPSLKILCSGFFRTAQLILWLSPLLAHRSACSFPTVYTFDTPPRIRSCHSLPHPLPPWKSFSNVCIGFCRKKCKRIWKMTIVWVCGEMLPNARTGMFHIMLVSCLLSGRGSRQPSREFRLTY